MKADNAGFGIDFCDNYFVILPSTPLWNIEKFKNESNASIGDMCKSDFSYNSLTNNHFLTVDELRNLIENRI